MNDEWIFSPVSEVYVSFDSGIINGSIDGCNHLEVADALERVAQFLRTLPETPGYVDFDEGKLFMG
jgi:hypothetical protein